MTDATKKKLKQITSTYSFWGKFGLYNLAVFITFLERERTIRKKAVRQLQLHKGDRVIDIACGTGRNFAYLVKTVGTKGTVVGFDLTPEMLNRARQQVETRGWKNVLLIQGDAAQINLPLSSFDGVISVLGFSVFPQYKEAIRRAVALLKENGKIVICDAVPFQGVWRIFNFIVKPIYRCFACWDPQKDILGTLQKHVAKIDIQWLNGRSIFIATGRG